MPSDRKLECYRGGRHRPVRLGRVDLVIAPVEDPPFPVEVQVVEEDTWRLLSPPAVLRSSLEHPMRLMTRVIEDRPAQPGELLCRGDRWRAVVYDLEQEPVCRESWIATALSRILASAANRGRVSLALPLLGATQGGIPWTRSLALIGEALLGCPLDASLRRVWLQLEGSPLPTAGRLLRGLAASTHLESESTAE